MSQGERATLGIGFQNSYGGVNGQGYFQVSSFAVVQVSSVEFLGFLDHDLSPEIPHLIDESILQRFDEGDSEEGPHMVGGTINFNAHPLGLGVLCTALMGQPTSTQANSVYSHVWEPRTSDAFEQCAGDPMTIWSDLDVGSALVMYDMAATSIQFAIANGDFLKVALGVVGGNHTRQAALAASFDTGRRFSWDQSSVSLGGTGIDKLRDITITVNDNLEAMHTDVPAPTPSRIKRTGRRTVEVSGTILFEDHDQYDDFASGQEQELDITLTGPSVVSGGADSFRIQIPLFRFEAYPVTPGGAGPIEVSFTGRGKYSTTSATSIRCTLVNTRTTYFGS